MIDTLLAVDWTGIILWICVVALILCGVAGTVVPALPGIPMIFLGALLAAWIGDFQHITWVPLVVLGVLTVIGLAVDWWRRPWVRKERVLRNGAFWAL